jgi:hypothetical protein
MTVELALTSLHPPRPYMYTPCIAPTILYCWSCKKLYLFQVFFLKKKHGEALSAGNHRYEAKHANGPSFSCNYCQGSTFMTFALLGMCSPPFLRRRAGKSVFLRRRPPACRAHMLFNPSRFFGAGAGAGKARSPRRQAGKQHGDGERGNQVPPREVHSAAHGAF